VSHVLLKRSEFTLSLLEGPLPRPAQSPGRLETLLAKGKTTDSDKGPHWKLETRLDRTIRRYEALLLATALVVITAFSLLYAHYRPFWLDEFLTYDTATLGSSAAVWNCLRILPMSVDPPLYHVMLHYWLHFLAPTEFAARLPSVFAYTLTCFCLYYFVRKYLDIYAGFIALMLALSCGAFDWADETRPYAFVLGAVSVALCCWSVVVDHRKGRTLALLGMWVAIAIAVGSHWFGCLVSIPFILGEFVRNWEARKFDPGVWVVVITASATAILYFPLLKAASAYRAMPWIKAPLWSAFQTFDEVLGPCVIPLTVLLIVILIMRSASEATDVRSQVRSFPAPFFTCIVALSLISFPGLVLAKLVTHVMRPRYVLFCVIGLLALLSQAVENVVRASPARRIGACMILGLCVLLVRIHDLKETVRTAHSEMSAITDTGVFSQRPSVPIVFSDDEDTFLRIQAHGLPTLQQRTVWVTDSGAPKMTGQSTTYLSIEALRLWTHDPIRDLAQFLSEHDSFYYVENRFEPNSWMLQRLIEDHAEISLQGKFAKGPVYFIKVRR
jgi:uncharacterized membrane protein